MNSHGQDEPDTLVKRKMPSSPPHPSLPMSSTSPQPMMNYQVNMEDDNPATHSPSQSHSNNDDDTSVKKAKRAQQNREAQRVGWTCHRPNSKKVLTLSYLSLIRALESVKQSMCLS